MMFHTASHTTPPIARVLPLVCLFALAIAPAASASTITVQDMTAGVTGADLVAALLGPDSGCIVSNIQVTGNSLAAGTFSNGGGLGFDTGVVISSGTAKDVENDISFGADTGHGVAGDSVLNTLIGGTTYDAFVLEFDFVPEGDGIFFKYRFGSEESFSDTYDDAFGLFVNGTNVALLPNASRVSVVNIGTGELLKKPLDITSRIKYYSDMKYIACKVEKIGGRKTFSWRARCGI